MPVVKEQRSAYKYFVKRYLRFEQYTLLALFLALFFVVLYPFLQGILLGLFVSIVFYPINMKIREKLRLPPWASAVLSTTLLSIFVVLPLFFIVYTLVRDAIELFSNSGDWVRQLNLEALEENFLVQKVRPYLPGEMNSSELRQKLVEIGSQAGSYVAGLLGRSISGVPDFLFQVIMFILATYYGLVDGQSFKAFIMSVLPFEKQDLGDLVDTTERIVGGVLWGSLLAGAAQGTVIALGFFFLGVPRPLFFGLVTVIFSFIPMIGSLATGLGGAIYLGTQGRWGAALVMLGIFGLASVSDNVVKPWTLSGNASLHPLLGLTSALGGLVIFGFLGLFLGPLLVALTIALLEIMQRREPNL